jgi:hypothetical protein
MGVPCINSALADTGRPRAHTGLILATPDRRESFARVQYLTTTTTTTTTSITIPIPKSSMNGYDPFDQVGWGNASPPTSNGAASFDHNCEQTGPTLSQAEGVTLVANSE